MNQDAAAFARGWGIALRGDDAFGLKTAEDLASAWETNAEGTLNLGDRGVFLGHDGLFDHLILILVSGFPDVCGGRTNHGRDLQVIGMILEVDEVGIIDDVLLFLDAVNDGFDFAIADKAALQTGEAST